MEEKERGLRRELERLQNEVLQRDQCLWLRIWGFGCAVSSLGFRIYVGFGVLAVRCRV